MRERLINTAGRPLASTLAGELKRATDSRVPSERGLNVIVVGPFPPPTHGAAVVTSAVYDALESLTSWTVKKVDTSAVGGSSRISYLLRRLRAHAWASLALLGRGTKRDQVLYLAGAGGLGLWLQVLPIMIARLARVRIVFHHHSYAPLRRRLPRMTVVCHLMGQRGRHIALCPEMASRLKTLYGAKIDVVVISNSAFLSARRLPSAMRVRGDTHAGREQIVVGHLGNLSTAKGLTDVLQVLSLGLEERLPLKLLLAGPCATPEAEGVLNQAWGAYGHHLEYLGALPRSEIGSFYHRLDFFLFPSRYLHEAEPLVVLEALTEGVPVLATDVGCVACRVGSFGAVFGAEEHFARNVVSYLHRFGDSSVPTLEPPQQAASVEDFLAVIAGAVG